MAHSSPITINTKKAHVFDMKKNNKAEEEKIAVEIMTGDLHVPVSSFEMRNYRDKVSLLEHYLVRLPRYKFQVSWWDESTFKINMPQAKVVVFVRVRNNGQIALVWNGAIVRETTCVGTIMNILNRTADVVRKQDHKKMGVLL